MAIFNIKFFFNISENNIVSVSAATKVPEFVCFFFFEEFLFVAKVAIIHVNM